MCRKQITLSKIDKICLLANPNQISTMAMVKIHWYVLKLSSGNKTTDVSMAVNYVKHWWNEPTNNPIPDLYNINAHTKIGENPLKFTRVIVRNKKNQTYRGQISLSKNDEFSPLAIPNQISTISMHIPSLMKIHWHSLKLSSGNKNTDGWVEGRTTDRRTYRRTDGQTDGHTDDHRETIRPRHYR